MLGPEMSDPGPGDADHDGQADDGDHGDGEEHGLVCGTQ
jgi:hypothetical protein